MFSNSNNTLDNKISCCFLYVLFKTIIYISLFLFSCYAFPYAQPQEADLQESIDKILLQISEKLQLPIKNKINIGFKDRVELEKYLIDRLHQEYPEGKLIAMQRAYSKIGLLPKDISLKELLIELYTEQVAGFYEPEKKELFLIKGFDPALQQAIMVHELAHALQDQHFNLNLLVNSTINNDDLLLARQAIIEGQATAVMLEIFSGLNINQLPELGPLLDSTLAMPMFASSALVKAPEYIRKHLLFPYSAGTTFVQKYYSVHQGYNAIQLFSQLPSSTEQLLHLEKYLDNRDEPVSIEVKDLEAYVRSSWRPLYSDVIGELDLSIILNNFLSAEEVQKVSEGWDGSRFYTFDRAEDDRVLLIWITTFDQEKDALEFFQSYRKVIRAKYKKEKLADKEAKKFFQWQTEEGLVHIEAEGNDVVIIEGIEPEFLSKVKKLCFDAKKIPY